MFTSWAERSGLFNRLAPRRKNEKEESSTDGDETTAEKKVSEEEEKLQREYEHKKRVLEGQREREMKARAEGKFTKNQRARYQKSPDMIHDAHIVGVHYDDGVENPYYTIQYERENGDRVEKQTTPDRLEHVDFDEEKAWAILSKK